MYRFKEHSSVKYLIGIPEDANKDYLFIARHLNMDGPEVAEGYAGIKVPNYEISSDELLKILSECNLLEKDKIKIYAVTESKNIRIHSKSSYDVYMNYIEGMEDRVFTDLDELKAYEDSTQNLLYPDKDPDLNKSFIHALFHYKDVRFVKEVYLYEDDLVQTLLDYGLLYKNEFIPRRILIAGTRIYDKSKYEEIKEIMFPLLDELNMDPKRDSIISGTAKGVDTIGEEYAKEHSIRVLRCPANWDKFGKAAGYKRNYQMGVLSTEGIVFWDGKSSGSKSMIDIMYKLHKRCIVYNYNNMKEL